MQVPLRCSRQWHILSFPLVARRAFGHQPLRGVPNTPFLTPRNSHIIIPSGVEGTTPKHFLDELQPLKRDYFRTDRVAVFFLTPAFAHWVLDDNIFLRHAVNRIFRRVVDGSITRHSGMKVHTVVAVVDKLPTPSPVHDLGALEAGAMHRMRTPPVGDVGSEGMAYVTLNASAVQFKERASPDEESTITLVTSRNAESQTVEVPLAETIFQTGTPTTMFRSSWSKPEENIPMDRVAKIDLGRLILRLCQDKGAEQCSALAVPLIPLTFPRIVKSGMGNIVRQFVGPEGDAVTASGELEKVVPQYTKSRNEPPQAMQVWALVIPQHVSKSVQDKTYELLEDTREIQSDSSERVWARLWARDPPKWTGIVPLALSKGARLHRVLSGGGGWGKKAGLLSLDPSVHVAKPASRDDAGEYDALAELSASMQPVVHPGDSIQFFASPPDGKGSGNPELTPVLRPWMWEWGTIPSTIDERSKSWQYAPSSASHVIHHFRGVFGALSEAGFTLKQRELGESDSGEDLTVEHTTKVDVPFSRFSVINLGRRDKQEESLPGQQYIRVRLNQSVHLDMPERKLVTLAEHPEMTEPLRETLHGADQNRQQAGAPPIRRVMAARYCLSQTTERELTPSKTAEDKLNRIPLRKFPVRDADLSARAQGIERVITRERRKLLAIIHHSLYIHVKWLDRNMHRLERVINHLVRRLKFRSVRSRLARPLVRLVISEKPPPVRKYVAKQSRIRIIRSRVRASKRAKAKEGARDKLMDEIIAWLRTP